jgi:hypothetical protein
MKLILVTHHNLKTPSLLLSHDLYPFFDFNVCIGYQFCFESLRHIITMIRYSYQSL